MYSLLMFHCLSKSCVINTTQERWDRGQKELSVKYMVDYCINFNLHRYPGLSTNIDEELVKYKVLCLKACLPR